MLIEGGQLKEKILLEYKTAKSSRGVQIDGNAHERLTFQMMQYLEIAATYRACSLIVVTNGAFARYRNKYHVNFQIQAERLRAFPWFNLFYACEPSRYAIMAHRIAAWLSAPLDQNADDAPPSTPDPLRDSQGDPQTDHQTSPERKPPILPARHLLPSDLFSAGHRS